MRAFIIAGFAIGAVIYIRTLSRYYIKYGVRLIQLILKLAGIIIIKPLKLLLSVFRMMKSAIKLKCKNK